MILCCSRSPSAREQSSCVQVSSKAWKVPPTFATATGKLSISTFSTCPGWMLLAFATVTNRAMSVSFLTASIRAAGTELSRVLRGRSRRRSAPGAARAPGSGRSRAAVLIVPARDLVAGREPDGAMAPHEAHQLFEKGHARGATADERMAGQDEAAVLLVHRRELAAPHLEHATRVGDRV